MARSKEKVLFGAMFVVGLLAAAITAYGLRSSARHADPRPAAGPNHVESAPATSPAAANVAERDPGPIPPQPPAKLALPEGRTAAIAALDPFPSVRARTPVAAPRQRASAVATHRLRPPHPHRTARRHGHVIVVVRGASTSRVAFARRRQTGPRIVRYAE